MDNALHAAVEFVQNHSDQTFTVDAGDILGVEGSITVTETDSGINFSGRLGGGLGIGFGGSADLIEGHAGSTGSGWGWLLSGAGGNGITGGSASVSRIDGGHWAGAAGVGVGFEGGASLTYGYSGDIGTIPMKSLSSTMSSKCGCNN